jgi:putative flavoprotein involved in K+ transport
MASNGLKEMSMAHQVETVIIGGGQAGLATSYHLGRLGHENIVLEQSGQVGNAWLSDRWDSFTLVTPNWGFRLPGAEFDSPNPDGFMPRNEIIERFERCVERNGLPIRYHTRVTAVEPHPAGRGYRVRTREGEELDSDNVVIATGLFQQPKFPAIASELSPDVIQLSSGQYRHPASLPPGAVLVVGSAQSGCQIAEELYQSGRRVYLCVSSAGRIPRRYRGKDTFGWFQEMGMFDRTVDKLESPREKFKANPHVSGAKGGHSLNLHQFAHDGVVLLGRLVTTRDHTIGLAPDLPQKLAAGDQFEAEFVKMIDKFIAESGIGVPEEALPHLRDGYDVEIIRELDLRAAGISTIIWATGYRFDFSMVKFPVFDNDGYPVNKRGMTATQGLYFVGLPWLYAQGSGLLYGVGQDAAYIAEAIAGKPA